VLFLKTQFDKMMCAVLFLAMCAFAFFASGNEKFSAFALQSAAGLLGCLLTLVTARRGANNELFPPDSTSSTTTANVTTISKTEVPEPKT
jgi:hypothetical protein